MNAQRSIFTPTRGVSLHMKLRNHNIDKSLDELNSIYAVNIDSFSDFFDKWLYLVEPTVRHDILLYKQEKDRHRKLASFLLSRFLAKKFLGITKYNISTNPFGKPFFKDYPNFCYNLSHSGKWVVAAVSDKSIGIDVEMIHTLNDFLDIAKRFYSTVEYNSLLECQENSRLDLFYNIWTKKESMIKAIGKGLSIPLSSFNVPLGAKGNIDYEGHRWWIYTPSFIDADYKISFCTYENKEIFSPVKYIALNTLLEASSFE